jgi:cell division protein FtsQ
MWPLSRNRASAKTTKRGRANPIRWRRVLRGLAIGWLLVALAGGTLALVYDGHLARAGRALAAGGVDLSKDAGLAVREVYVTGRVRTGQASIVRALALRQDDPMLGFDPDEVRARLLALPWVKTATVTRKLPQTVEVTITERDPLALWRDGRGTTLIDRDGVPIRIRDLKPYAGLPLLQGDDAPANAAALLDVLRLDPGLYEQVKLARRVGGRRWDVLLDNGIAIHLPEEKLKAAWRQLATLANEKGLFDRDIVAVDLRLPDRLVVRLSPEAAARRRDPGQRT